MNSIVPTSETSIEQPLTIGQIADELAKQSAHIRYSSTKAANTLRRHKADLTLFFHFLGECHYEQPIQTFFEKEDWKLWSGITYGLVEAYVLWLTKQGYAIGSINVRLATVRIYCELAQKAGTIEHAQFASIKLVKGYSHKEGVHLDRKREMTRRGKKKSAPVSLSSAHAALLKQQPDDRQGRKDAALMCFMLDLGFRCGELARLRVEDINLEQATLVLYREKVDKKQTHQLTPDALAALHRYLPDVTGPYLFSGYKGKHMSTRGINKRVGELGALIGISDLSPHDCRHYWATSAIRGGTDIKSLQDAGGWSSPAMPLRYAESSKIANSGVKLG